MLCYLSSIPTTYQSRLTVGSSVREWTQTNSISAGIELKCQQIYQIYSNSQFVAYSHRKCATAASLLGSYYRSMKGKKDRWGSKRVLLPRSSNENRSSSKSGFQGRASRYASWSRVAWRLVAAAVAFLVSLHLTSGSLVTIAYVPSYLGSSASAQLKDLVQLSGDTNPSAVEGQYLSEADNAPKLIPRIIHQTYKTGQLPAEVKEFMATWRQMNPGWDMRFYDDRDCIEFVKHEFPEYLDAYRRLSKDVERSDFFR